MLMLSHNNLNFDEFNKLSISLRAKKIKRNLQRPVCSFEGLLNQLHRQSHASFSNIIQCFYPYSISI